MKFYVKNGRCEGSDVYNEYKEVFDLYITEVLYDVNYFSNIGYLVIELNSLEDIMEFESKLCVAVKNKPKTYAWEIRSLAGVIISNSKESDFPKVNYPTIEIYDNYRE